MSKIALTPSATGTGVFTISSPATNTDRTLTLPDEAGSIVVNTDTGIDVTGVLTTTAATVFNGGFAANAASTITSADNLPQLNLVSTDADALVGPQLNLWRNSGSAANGDLIGQITFTGEDSLSNTITYASIHGVASQVDNGAEDGTLHFSTRYNDVFAERLQIQSDGTTAVTNASGSVNLGVLQFSTQAATYQIRGGNNIGYLGYLTGGYHRWFGSDASEDMRLDGSGNLLVGTTDSNPYNNSAGSTADNGIALGATGIISSAKYNDNCAAFNRTGTDGGIISFRKSGGNCGSISVTASSTAYNTSSDYRLKTDAQPMTGASARVLALKPVNFAWIVDGSRVDGFLAHEAQEVVPECVTGTKDAMRDEEYEVTAAIEATYDEDGNELTAAVEAVMGTRSVPDYQGIDQSKLVPLLTAALQEALNKIAAMEIRLAALEAV
jgi:hypothetical protein